MIPHPDKKQNGGEDAFYVNDKILSVADGVGGWIEQGLDPSLYSKQLCKNVQEFFTTDKKKYSNNPKELIVESVLNNKEMGTSTLVILTIDQKKQKIKSSLIGDSGYMILRLVPNTLNKYKMIFKSQDMLHEFNMPYQVGTQGDHPSKAEENEHDIRKTDIIVMGTDGLFDNMYIGDIIKEIQQHLEKDEFDGGIISKRLAEKAFELSKNDKNISPFAEKARDEGYEYMGGKMDDITIIVAKLK